MKRKTSTLQTRVYSYGALPPTSGGERMEEQFKLAHRYYNELISIYRRRRERIAQIQKEHGTLGPLLSAVATAESELEAAVTRVKASKAGRAVVDAEAAEMLRAVRVLLRSARARVKEGRAALRDELKPLYGGVTDALRAEVRGARAACGVYWGTYLKIEEAAEQADRASGPVPPRFRSYDGSGKLAVQLQHGIAVNEVMSCLDTRLRIQAPPADTYDLPRHRRRIASRTKAWVRIGSTSAAESTSADSPPRNGSPIFVEVPIVLHRPLPPDASIKWAWLLRRRIGLHFEYRLQIVLEAESFSALRSCGDARAQAIAIDLGWRNLPDGGGIRVAYWHDTDGAHGQVRVPEKVSLGLAKCDDLRSIRDNNFNAIKLGLRAWLGTQPEIPEWLRERVTHLHQWHAQGRLAGLLRLWRAQRIAGDEDIWTRMESWAKQDRHLLAWEAHQRDRRINHRRETYQVWATQIARQYRTVVLERFDLTAFATLELPEDGDPADGLLQRYTARLAAPGELREAIIKAAARTGAAIVQNAGDTRHSTTECDCCGTVGAATPQLMIVCNACGVEHDQDARAARNLLRRWRERDSGDVPPSKSSPVVTPTDDRPAVWRSQIDECAV